MRTWWSDARHFQIVALSSLLAINFVWIDFGAKPLYSALAISSALLTQIICSRLSGLPKIDLRSPLITGLSLSLLLRANEPWLPAIAGIHRHCVQVRAADRWPAHLQSGRLRHRRTAADVERRLDFARAMGHQPLARDPIGVLRHSGLAGRATLGHRAVLSRQPRRAAVCPRLLAGRPARHPVASTPERIAPDLCVLHDLRSEDIAGFTRRRVSSLRYRSRSWPTISRFSCRCGRRST